MTAQTGRRAFLATLSALPFAAALPRAALALTGADASDLVGRVVADICTFEDPEVIESLYLDRLRQGAPIPKPSLTRFVIDPEGRISFIQKNAVPEVPEIEEDVKAVMDAQ